MRNTRPQYLSAGATVDTIALLSARDCVELTSYRAALSSEQAPEWQAAMQHEYSSVMANGKWELVDLRPDCMVVHIMWIHKVKSDTKGDVSRFKARFVAKGSSQPAGLDYTETFSPVSWMASLRLFLAIAAAMDLEFCHLRSSTPPSKRTCTSVNHSASRMALLKRVI
jgi:hypothetical protein